MQKPHKTGVSSTLVWRLLHTSVLLAPHLIGSRSTQVWPKPSLSTALKDRNQQIEAYTYTRIRLKKIFLLKRCFPNTFPYFCEEYHSKYYILI